MGWSNPFRGPDVVIVPVPDPVVVEADDPVFVEAEDVWFCREVADEADRSEATER